MAWSALTTLQKPPPYPGNETISYSSQTLKRINRKIYSSSSKGSSCLSLMDKIIFWQFDPTVAADQTKKKKSFPAKTKQPSTLTLNILLCAFCFAPEIHPWSALLNIPQTIIKSLEASYEKVISWQMGKQTKTQHVNLFHSSPASGSKETRAKISISNLGDWGACQVPKGGD